MTQVCRRVSAGSCSLIGVRETDRLSMKRQAMMAAKTPRTSHSSGTLCSQICWPAGLTPCEAPKTPRAITNGPMNWTAGTPMLPPAALMPRAEPRWRSG